MNRLVVALALTAILFVPLVVVGGSAPVAEPSVTGPDEVAFHDEGTFEATVPTRGDVEIESLRLEVVDPRTNGTVAARIVDRDDGDVSIEPLRPTDPSESEQAGWFDHDTPGGTADAPGQAAGTARGPAASDDWPPRSAARSPGRVSDNPVARLLALKRAMFVTTPFVNDVLLQGSLGVTAERAPPGAGYGYGYGGNDAGPVTYQVTFDGHAFVPDQEYGLRITATTASGDEFTSNVARFEVTHRHGDD